MVNDYKDEDLKIISKEFRNRNFSGRLCNFRTKYGYADKNGNEVIPCVYDYAYPFKNGVAIVGTIEGTGEYIEGLAFEDRHREKTITTFSYINKKGKVIFGNCDEAGDFIEELALVKRQSFYCFGKYLRINDNKFSSGYLYINNEGCVVIDASDYEKAYPFSESLALVKTRTYGIRSNKILHPGKYRYIDKEGKVVIDASEYDEAYPFYKGLARVGKNGKYGFIDKKGNLVVNCMLEENEIECIEEKIKNLKNITQENLLNVINMLIDLKRKGQDCEENIKKLIDNIKSKSSRITNKHN